MSATTEKPRLALSTRGVISVLGSWLSRYGTLLALAAMIAIFGIARPDAFLSSNNLIQILNQAAILAIVAGGLTFPLVSGQFDLSFAAVISFAGILVIGFMSNQGLPWWGAILLVVLIGAVIGLVNGLVVTGLRVSPIIATLAMTSIISGINYTYSNGTPIPLGISASPVFTKLALGKIVGIPYPVIFMVVVLGFLWVLLNRTRFGHHAQAIGSNSTAAGLSGVRVSRITIGTFAIGAGCAAIAGILLASRIGSGQVTAGDGFLLSAFAATFLGSAVLRDGEFHIFGTLVGVLIVTVGFNGLSIIGAASDKQYYFQGGVLVVAMALSTTGRRLIGIRRTQAVPKDPETAVPAESAVPAEGSVSV